MHLLPRAVARGAFAGVLCLLVTASAALASTVDLRPKFRKGDVAKYDLVLNSDNDFNTGGAAGAPAQKQKIDQNIGLKLTVLDSNPDTGATVELVYERLKFKSQGDLPGAEFDSSQPASKDAGNQAAQALRPLIGTKLTLTVDPDGNITEVKGGESFANAFMDQMQGNYVTPGGMNGMFGPVFSTRKAQTKAAVGDSWTYVDTLPGTMLGEMKLTTTHTVKSINGDLATVDLTGKYEVRNADTGLNLSVNNSSYEGSYVWDSEAGMLKSMQTRQVTNVRADIGGGAVTVKSSSKTTITRRN